MNGCAGLGGLHGCGHHQGKGPQNMGIGQLGFWHLGRGARNAGLGAFEGAAMAKVMIGREDPGCWGIRR